MSSHRIGNKPASPLLLRHSHINPNSIPVFHAVLRVLTVYVLMQQQQQTQKTNSQTHLLSNS